MDNRMLSFVIPAMDEEPTLLTLTNGIADVVEPLGYDYELILIDDGSSDDSWSTMQKIAQGRPDVVRAVRMRRNVGKARALAAGFKRAQGDLVFTMDADLQDDPQEIPRFIKKIDEGFDAVSGYKQVRHDPWHKVLPSRVFNKMVSKLNGVTLHDHNCGFKCYRAEVIKDVRLYGELHRMVPCLASIEGYQTAEIVVQHHPREFGKSKYGIKRFLRGFLDMTSVAYLKNYAERPLHLWGGIGLLALALGAGSVTVGGSAACADHAAAPFVVFTGYTLLLASLVCMGFGYLSELIVSGRTGFKEENRISEDTGVPENRAPHFESNLVRFESDVASDLRAPGQTPSEILIVDDSLPERALASHYVEPLGMKIVESSDGREALGKVGPQTAVILLDMRMPHLDGLGFLTAVKGVNPYAKVVIVSCKNSVDDAVQAMKLGAFDYISKPFQRDDLQATVRTARQAFEVALSYQRKAQ